MNQSDLQIGMYLTNQGPGTIPVYNNLDGTGKVMTTIAPGELIGQIADIRHGAEGVVCDFVSDKITAAGNILEKAVYYTLGWLVDPVKIAGAVRFPDLEKNVKDAQVQQQRAAIAAAEANGTSIKNMIVKVAKNIGEGISETVTGVIPWKAIGIGVLAWFAFNNRQNISDAASKKLFPSTTKK